MNRRLLALAAALAFVGCVFGANWALERYGIVSVGFGLTAPAGVYFAGLAFLLRDATQELGGRKLVVAAILAGAGASYFVSSRFALASGVAFTVSELCDWGVYSRIVERSLIAGVVASNFVGAAVDSAIFLALAGLPLSLVVGQVVGKLWVTAAAVVPLIIYNHVTEQRGATS